MTFLEHEGWAKILSQSCGLFALAVILLTLRRSGRRNRKVGLPKPSDRCKRNGPESLP